MEMASIFVSSWSAQTYLERVDELRLDVVQRTASIVLWTVGAVLFTLPLLAGSPLRPARRVVAAVGIVICCSLMRKGGPVTRHAVMPSKFALV